MSRSQDLAAGLSAMKLSTLSNEVFSLLNLVDEERNHIISYLSIWDLMNLRVVCKTTKAWVDQSHLEKFVLTVKTHQKLEELANLTYHQPAWKNVKILCDSGLHNQNWIANPHYSKMLQNLSSSLTILVLDDHRVPYDGLISIMSTCHHLKVLEMGILDCKGVAAAEFEIGSDVARSLKTLESLKIGCLAWDSKEDLKLFKQVLFESSRLIFLKAPHILMANLFTIGDDDDEDTDKKYLELVKTSLTVPLVEYMERRLLCFTDKGIPCLKELDVENLHHTEVFPDLAMACFKTKTYLLNVSEAYEDPVPTAQETAAEIIRSLSGFTAHLNFHRLTHLKSIQLDSETSADSVISTESITANLANLKQIQFCLPQDIDRSIITCLLKKPRKSVRSLKIEFEASGPDLAGLFQASNIVSSFNSLTELSLTDWDGQDKEISVLLKGLSCLESLRLQRCMNITDEGLIGEDDAKPLLSSLSALKTLWLECEISDSIFVKAIRNMTLEELFFASSLRITATGLSSLTTGAFADSIILFRGTQPDECDDVDFEKILQSFKNLKRKPLGF